MARNVANVEVLPVANVANGQLGRRGLVAGVGARPLLGTKALAGGRVGARPLRGVSALAKTARTPQTPRSEWYARSALYSPVIRQCEALATRWPFASAKRLPTRGPPHLGCPGCLGCPGRPLDNEIPCGRPSFWKAVAIETRLSTGWTEKNKNLFVGNPIETWYNT